MNRWSYVGLWMALILVLSVGPTGPEVSDVWPYVVHFLEYAILGMLLYGAIVYTWDMAGARASVWASATAFAYGASMEMIQIPLSHRGFAVDDLVINLAGAVAGVIVYRLAGRRRSRRDGGCTPA